MSTNEYVKVLEEYCGKNQAHKKKHIKKSIGVNALYIPEKQKPDYSWTIKDRFNNLWKNFLIRFEYLSKYNLFDFKSYENEWNPYGFDIYAKIFQTSTPWNRFKRFCMELKGLYRGCKDAFFYTPLAVKHYQKNKKRIDWFEENLSKLFSDKLDVDIRKKLNKHGYDLDGKGKICYKVKE